jgi:hypothetical protein
MKFTRDDLMVLERGLRDRIESLRQHAGFLIGHEIDKCKRLRAVLKDEIDRTWVKP